MVPPASRSSTTVDCAWMTEVPTRLRQSVTSADRIDMRDVLASLVPVECGTIASGAA
jgi:hypothetical protein